MNITRAWLAFISGTLITLLALNVAAQSQVVSAHEQLDRQTLIMRVYVRPGCPHCTAAKEYLPSLARQFPQLQVVYRDVSHDSNARDELIALFRERQQWPPSVPTFVVEDSLLSGFEDADTSGPKLAELIQGQQLQQRIESSIFGELSVEQLGLPLFTLAIGLLDGFNPCAMWVLLFLLSMLVHLKDRKRMLAIAGTFVLVSGAIYYAFMAAWLNLFMAVGLSQALQLLLALVAITIGGINVRDYFKQASGFTLSIPDSAKPGLYGRVRRIIQTDKLLPAMIAAGALAVVVNFIELLCTAGFPAIYSAILTQQDLSMTAHYGYLLLYILGYMADDALMVGTAVLALSSNKLTESSGRRLKLISGLVMLTLGIIMLIKPEWLL